MVEIVLLADPGLTADLVPDAEIATAAGLLQAWLEAEVAPAWSQGGYRVIAVPRGQPAPTPGDNVWLFWVSDGADVPGAGGYHDIDNVGNPFARIFAGDARRAGYPWTVPLTHEAAETCVNRFVQTYVLAPYLNQDAAYFMEVCDPFEAGPNYSYLWQGHLYRVSNFALPSYFKPRAKQPYDRLGLGTAPLTPTRGGRQTLFPLGGQPITLNHAGEVAHRGADARLRVSIASGPDGRPLDDGILKMKHD